MSGEDGNKDDADLQQVNTPMLMRQETLKVDQLSKDQKKALYKVFWVDELYHTAGVLNLAFGIFVVARWPEHFWLLHVVLTAILLPMRYFKWRKDGMELYMTDFCYFASYATFVCCLLSLVRVTTGITTFLHHYNSNLIRSGFAFATGPLAWSIWIFGNSLVFHQIDHTTSVFIHLYPAVLMWCLRWGGGLGLLRLETAWPNMFDVCPGMDPAEADKCLTQLWCRECPTGIKEMIFHPIIVYLCWAIPHYLFLFVYWGEKELQAAGKESLYIYLKSKPGLASLFDRVPFRLHPFLYLSLHFLSVTMFGSLGLALWHSFPLHTLFLIWVFYLSVKNGSSYFFKVFGMRYAQEQVKKNKSELLKQK